MNRKNRKYYNYGFSNQLKDIISILSNWNIFIERIKNTNKNSTKDYSQNKVKNFVKKYGINITMVIATYFLVIIAGIQTSISNKATNATIKSVQIAEQSMKITNRAYLGFKTITPTYKAISDKFFIKVEIINLGNTPAYNVSFINFNSIGNESMFPIFNNLILGQDSISNSIFNVFPIASIIQKNIVGENAINFINIEFNISDSDYKKVKKGIVRFVYFGRVRYVDIFNKQQWFNFFLVYFPEDSTFRYYKKYNIASQNN